MALKRFCGLTLMASFVTCSICHAQVTRSNPGLQSMSDLRELPLLYAPGTQTKQFSSYDLSGGNRDGNLANAFTKYIDINGDIVIFDDDGPGALYRQQMNVWKAAEDGPACDGPVVSSSAIGASRIRFFFDGEEKPRIDETIDEYFAEGMNNEGIFAYLDKRNFYDAYLRHPEATLGSPNFGIQYMPIGFARHLKITIAPSPEVRRNMGTLCGFWYQFTYLVFPQNSMVASWRSILGNEDSDAYEQIRRQWSNSGKQSPITQSGSTVIRNVIAPPHTSVKLFELGGPATITSLKLWQMRFAFDAFYGVDMRIFWDGLLAPSIDMPLSAFFGGGTASFASGKRVAQQLANLMYGFSSTTGEMFSYWPMPFWSTAKIVLINNTNRPVKYRAELKVVGNGEMHYDRQATGLFEAKLTTFVDDASHDRAPAFVERGLGHVVGTDFWSTNYAVDGDEFTYIDGSNTPQIHGDGTEDDHNQGWGGSNLQKPLWGSLIDGRRGSYRLRLSDPYVFFDGISSFYELSKDGSSSASRTAVVTYYYKKEVGIQNFLRLTDIVDIGSATSEEAHKYSISGEKWNGEVRSGYDAPEKSIGTQLWSYHGRAFSGSETFTVAIDRNNAGIKLRRLTSRAGNGRRVAEVWVDGSRLSRDWSITQNSSAPAFAQWQESDYEVPFAVTAGRSAATIKLVYKDSTNGTISDFFYKVFSYVLNDNS
ncbi:MAG: DUF2961 domain-containing protein [Steroidobacteraceae bacterium]